MQRAPSDTPARSLLKSVLWTVIGLVVMVGVGLVFTGSWSLGGGMAVTNAVLGFLLYLIYERVWAAIRWGRNG